MSSRQSISTLGSGFSFVPTTSYEQQHPRRGPKISHSKSWYEPGTPIDPQGGKSQVNYSLVTSDRLPLSPSSSSSSFQYSIHESSLSSSHYPDQSSQSSYPHSPTEYYQPSYPRPERAGMALLDERKSTMARQEGPFSYPMQPARRSGIPLGFEHLLHPQDQSRQDPAENTVPPGSSTTSSRFRLHMRQQPIATRACAAGEKDRRPVDPPPILQMLLVDFNPDSETDQAILQNPQYVVGCLLYSVQRSPGGGGGEQERLVHSSHVAETIRKRQRDSPNRGIGVLSSSNEQQQQQPNRRFVQILSGRTHVSPFYTPYDPDPETAPEYPRTTPTTTPHHFSSREQGHPHPHQYRHHTHPLRTNTPPMPATFFAFPDLSVRAAGTYRLRFRLMDWGITAETGTAQPILAEVFSEPFRVYTSKDFPGMRGSSTLTWNLRKMGMMELKPREGRGKGVGKGKGKGKGKAQEKEREKED